ncbi:ras GTPase-activating protein-binding protein 2-like [Melia azedarach]|uniref:Ras GTPase-activating protein-binding protein 2-like n=1 Tax=Melia azedarach TaxID=155640 RepID=A0ACC1XAK1_MELAZ|nr:ras GTPase-activating protein-binding protein 2-like [Melia azedarach]
MVLHTASPPSAQVVGNAFVEQYYHILHNSPELVYRFYQDSSVLSRPDSNGVMTSVTTMDGINQKILSLDFKNYKAEIKTADAQNSHKEGVTVLVTGCLTGKDNLRRKFAQSFFLAPQDNGYFVLNDVFRYVEDAEVLEKYPVNNIDDVPAAPSIPDPELTRIPDPPAPDPATSHMEEDQNISETDYKPSDHERQLGNDKEAVVDSQSHAIENEASVTVESASSSAEDAPKKSYASIVKVAKGSGPTQVYVPTNIVKANAKKPEDHLIKSVKPSSSGTSATVSTNDPESSNAHEEVEGHSIYIRNLPVNMTAAALEMEFKKFGPIKEGGTQVRHNKGYCFGFVEFQSSSSINGAIEASPITIGGQEAVVEKKKNTRVSGGRGRFPSERERFRNDNFRGRGNYVGGRGFGRNEYGTRVEFQVRGRGSSGRGEGYQRGRGRGGRSDGGPKQTAPISA